MRQDGFGTQTEPGGGSWPCCAASQLPAELGDLRGRGPELRGRGPGGAEPGPPKGELGLRGRISIWCIYIYIYMYGVWCMVSSIWYLVYGIWYMISSIWYLVYCSIGSYYGI